MATVPMRIPKEIHQEVQTAARVFGCPTSALLERAWLSFSRSPEFALAFETAQEALSDGHVEVVALRLRKEEVSGAGIVGLLKNVDTELE